MPWPLPSMVNYRRLELAQKSIYISVYHFTLPWNFLNVWVCSNFELITCIFAATPPSNVTAPTTLPDNKTLPYTFSQCKLITINYDDIIVGGGMHTVIYHSQPGAFHYKLVNWFSLIDHAALYTQYLCIVS